MADRTIKPHDTNDLVLQNNDGSAKLELNEDQTVKFTTGSDSGEDCSVNTTQLVVEGDSGNVGIGTSSPTSFGGFTTVHHKNASGNALNLTETDGGVISQEIATDSSSGSVLIGARSNHPLRLTVNDTEKVRIDTSGDVTVSSGSLIVNTSGQGIGFGSTLSQHTLTDYEQGSFTAHLYGSSSGTGTIVNSTNAVYTKIGNVITIQMNWANISTSSLSGSLIIKNLPFTAHSTNVGVSSPISHINLGQQNSYLMINASTTTAEIFYNRAGTSYATETSPGVSGVHINITTTYRTA